MENHNFSFKKKFGQNFLIDNHVVSKIINGSDISEDDLVIEIGPGFGSLTQILSQQAKKVIAIEIDTNLIPILNDTLKNYDNVDILNMDALKVDFDKIICDLGFKSAKIVANLPYYITTPIIMYLLEKFLYISSVTIMIQKEVATRIMAKPKSKDYGSLTLAVNYYCDVDFLANVPSNCFIPRPNVDSAVIRLIRRDLEIAPKDESLMFNIIRKSFEQRRKTLLNCIYNLCGLGYDKDEIAEILKNTGYDINIRGEALTLNDFIKISDYIYCNKNSKLSN